MSANVDAMEWISDNEKWIHLPARWAFLLVGVIATRFIATYHGSPWLIAGVLGYALLNLLVTYRLTVGDGRKGIRRGFHYVLYAADIAFASQVIYYSGGLQSDMYLLYALLALKAAFYYPAWHDVLLFPFALGPLYVLVLYLSTGSLYFLPETFFLLRYALLFAVVIAAVYLGWLNEHNRSSTVNLRDSLAERTLDLDHKTGTMQRMATDLGNRLLELRTLQEGIKAINSALALEDVLRLIVANAAQVLEGAHCSVALFDEAHNQVVSMAISDDKGNSAPSTTSRFDPGIAAWVVRQGRPVLSGDVSQNEELAGTKDMGIPICSLISAPLFLDRDAEAIGALIATSPGRDAFTTEDLGQMNAFADQAAIAVKNARLYGQIAEEQRQTEQLYQHVQQRRNELEAILRGIGDGVIVTDPELNLLLMNPIATRIFCVKSDVTSSLPLPQVIPHQELLSLFQEALRGEEEAVVREITLPASGDRTQPLAAGAQSRSARAEMIYEALASPILNADGHARGVVTVLRDVTSQKELERMKSNFLSVVSHELKTPLHSIKGFVDIILMGKTGPLNETQTDFLGTVRDQTAHLQNLINDLLEFSRLESGQVKLRLTQVSLADVSAAVTNKLKLLADQGQVQLVNRVPVDIAPVEADEMRIEQVLSNLVDNALKFTPASGTVTVSAEDLGTEVQVAVSDTGIGIPAAEQARVFDRFYQVDSGSTRPYRGTGLGLTICKHIVEYHQGRIWVESEENKGSTFYFVLPKRIVAQDDQLLLDFMSLPKRTQN